MSAVDDEGMDNTHRPRLILLAALLGTAHEARGQQASVVSLAEDAFGSSAGNEEMGLYSENDVRGFSPIEAGNVRIEGLYADIPQGLGTRVSYRSSILVGDSTAQTLWSAPSGVVSYTLRDSEDPRGLRVQVDQYGHSDVQADGIHSATGLLAGAGWSGGGDDYRGTRPTSADVGVVLHSGDQRVRVTTFLEASYGARRVEPWYSLVGNVVPEQPHPAVFQGQNWARYRYRNHAAGVLLHAQLAPSSRLDVGLFHAATRTLEDSFDLFEDVGDDQWGERTIYRVPGGGTRSWSGEALLRHQRIIGQFDLTWFGGVRGRRSDSLYGGDVAEPLGSWRIGDDRQVRKPDTLPHGARTRDFSSQWSAMAGAMIRLGERLLLRVSVAPTRLTQTVAPPESPLHSEATSAVLYSALLRYGRSARLHGFLSVASGVEGNGVAPLSATNRGAVMPASVTRQVDAGLAGRKGGLGWTAALFEITRPNASMDDTGSYGLNGQLRHRGIEASVSAKGEHHALLLGGYRLFARSKSNTLSGEHEVEPLATPRDQAQLTWEYRPESARWSVDTTLTRIGTQRLRADSDLHLPATTTLDAGVRLQQRLLGSPATMRLRVTNLTGTHHFNVARDGSITPAAPREVSLTVQWETDGS